MHPAPSTVASPWSRLVLWMVLALCVALGSACGGDDDPAPPQITVQPADTSVSAGSTATLSVQASGTDLAYQWQRSSDGGTTWSDIAGATGDRLVTPVTTLADDGTRYRVVLSAAGVHVTSSAVRLGVTAAVVAPTLTVQPAAQAVVMPAMASFSVTASGTSPGYQWQRSTDQGASWAAVAGATTATHTTAATTLAMDGELYRVTVSNSAGNVTSAAARLTVSAMPAAAAITTPPSDRAVTAGSTAAFTAVASGSPAPGLQWQRSVDGGATWADIAGATASTYTTGITTVADDGQRLRVVASNSGGTATSSAARLTVTPAPQAPAVTTQPVNQTVTAPAAATFVVAGSGVPGPAVQWQLSTDGGSTWANIVGATASSYTTPATVLADSGKRYRAQLGNTSGSATSDAALLTVSAAPVGAAWQTAQALRGADAFAASHVAVAGGAAGQFVAVWLDTDDNAAKQLRASRHTPGLGWSAAVTVAAVSSTSGATMGHVVAMDPAGNAVVVFTSLSNNRQSVWASRQGTTGAWSTPVLLESEDGGQAELPALAIDEQGTATAAWQQNDTVFFPNSISTRRITTSRLVPGQPWTPPLDIDFTAGSGANGTGLPIHVGASPAGDVVVGWTTGTATGQVAAANVLRRGVGWTGAQQLVSGGTPTTATTVGGVAINDAGVALVAFRQLPSVPSNVFVARYTPATGWASPEFLGPNGDAARVLLGPDGTAVVAWDGVSGNSIRVTRGTAAGVWTEPFLVGGGFGTRIGRDAAGNVTLVFSDTANPRRMLSARWPATGALTAAGVIETATGVGSVIGAGALAVGADGQAAAVWIESETPRAVPWVNVYR